jgi:hypothetical protein
MEHGVSEVVEEHGLILVLRDVGQAKRGWCDGGRERG